MENQMKTHWLREIIHPLHQQISVLLESFIFVSDYHALIKRQYKLISSLVEIGILVNFAGILEKIPELGCQRIGEFLRVDPGC